MMFLGDSQASGVSHLRLVCIGYGYMYGNYDTTEQAMDVKLSLF